ncbi:GNAT family N-acetyltransferase [Minwuia thermotolerans]|uniref:GNAT family N-acetyltransferase n=1 Tax=Minwuia thermotolerans TaxID=2056226 RepID=A0A2M9FZL9_9PROT|nr:GNAT family N-acetyltransferase [Minwuia thermotolerans]PJK28900.1 GNAT family N-acetyltransferase [Minwuia thermotolerans]
MAETAVVRVAEGPSEIAVAKRFFLDYAASLDVDLCYQGFDQEMARFPGEYRPPKGALLLAWKGDEPVGVVGLRPHASGAAEMKRLYLTDTARGTGLGRRLAAAVVERARDLGYPGVVLDTLTSMTAAQGIYRKMGFREYLPAADGGHPDLLYFRLGF